MKKMRFLTELLILLVLIISICACGESSNQATNKNDDVKVSIFDDFESYKIVRSENSTEAEKDAMVKLHTAIKQKTGVLLKVATDFTAGTKEILVGNTKRQQSIDAASGLEYHDFVIKQAGNKIVIVGGSDEATEKAVDYFIENYIDGEKKTLIIPEGDGFMYIHQYKLKKFTVGGVDISEYKICSLSNTERAQKIKENMLNIYLGCELEIEEKETNGNYIILDSSQLDYDEYAIIVKDGNIRIKGSARSLDQAINEFYKIMDNASGGVLELAAEGTITGKIDLPHIPYKNKNELLKILEYLQNDDKLLFGQHLAGRMDLNESIASYAEAVGEGPSIMDIDMLRLREHPKSTWSELICQAVEYASKGGIITTMHHWLNPLHPEEGYRGRLDSLDQWQEVLTRGTDLNNAWHEELDRGAEFLKAIKDAGVSVMFRPLHEANGNWFWFCADYGELGTIDSQAMVEMWKYVYNYYTNDWGLDNLIWSYSPNFSNSTSAPLPVTYYYPGDEYCDVVGLDWYTAGEYEIDGSGKSWNNLLDYRKPTGLTEWGVGGTLMAETPEEQVNLWNCENYVDTLERMRSEGKSIAFAEVYSGRFGAPSYVGKGEALANYKYIVSLEEMPLLIKTILN